MSIGPVEYLIVGFPGNQFNGEIVPALTDLVDSGTVRIVDLLFITKDADGNVDAFEYEDHPELEPFGDLAQALDGLLNDEDIELAAEVLEPNSSAAFIVWEDLWARDFAEAVRGSGGVVIAGERIPHEIVVDALARLDND
ncbi:MAG: DUF1269 domain-containing protein [Actinobacteria bacterium]|nr:DUF1269 domain-containing protein [Actinomycetota bacterium]